MTDDTLYKAYMDKERKLKKRERQALLMQVDAIEEFLDMPKTSDIRQFAKDHGFYDIMNHLTKLEIV